MENISLVSSFLKMVFALAVVLGLLVGVMYLMRHVMGKTTRQTGFDAPINIVASRYLGPKSSILLVEVLDRLIVIGMSGQQMTALAQIDDPLAVARMKASHHAQSVKAPVKGLLAKYWSLLQFGDKSDRSVG